MERLAVRRSRFESRTAYSEFTHESRKVTMVLRGSNKMSLKARVAPQPAFGRPLLALLVSTHASATQISPPCEGGVRGVAPAEPWPVRGSRAGRASRNRRLGRARSLCPVHPPNPPFARGGKQPHRNRDELRACPEPSFHHCTPNHPFARGGNPLRVEVCVETNAPHSRARGLFVFVADRHISPKRQRGIRNQTTLLMLRASVDRRLAG